MFLFALIARLTLTMVFIVAGVAKLADLKGSRSAMIGFGVPDAIAGVAGLLLPVVEIITALLLVPAATVWIGAWMALGLLTAFAAAIGINLAQGRKPDCHCFGQLHSAPAGVSTLARNIALASAAALLVFQATHVAQPSLFGWFAILDASARALILVSALGLILFAAQFALLWQMLLQQGRMLLRLEAIEQHWASGLRPSPVAIPNRSGPPAPVFELEDLNGEFVSLTRLLGSGRALFLFFANPNCGPCKALFPEVLAWAAANEGRLALAIISEGSRAENRAKFADLEPRSVLLQRKREVAELYKAWGTPAATLISANGLMVGQTVQGAEAIKGLMAQSADNLRSDMGQGGSAANARAIGQRLPEFELQSLVGKRVASSAFRGQETLFVFWNPACGFCKQMLNDLRHWDNSPPAGAAKLVVISSGSADEARVMGLRSEILLDPDNRVAPLCGAHGTPMGLLVDGEGKIASHVAAGAAAVFDLAKGKEGVFAA